MRAVAIMGIGKTPFGILGDRVQIGDAVTFSENRDGVPFFRKAA